MEEGDTWMNLFFSGSPPDILNTSALESHDPQSFRAKDDNWELGSQIDKFRPSNPSTIQVFWLRIGGHRKYIAKVVSRDNHLGIIRVLGLIMYHMGAQFPPYSEQEAREQLRCLRVRPTPERINDDRYEFDRFHREARVYSHIDLHCSAREKIYFPRFQGVVDDIPKSRFCHGYYNKRAVVLEAMIPALYSRRVLSEVISSQSESFLTILETLSKRFLTAPGVITLSPFEQDWYHSLLKDRLRRLDALHRIGITHGDIHDFHFRLLDDIYDTALYDFSASYTFSMKRPLWVCGGRPRPLDLISEGEREFVLRGVLERVALQDFRAHLLNFSCRASIAGLDSQHIPSIHDALWQSLDEEQQFLELIILKVRHRPDGFSMPTLNSIFPFLEAICPNSDLCWHIRRGRLLCQYESVWAVFSEDKAQPQPITFGCEPQFEAIEELEDSRFMLCLLPHSWDFGSLKTEADFAGLERLRDMCSSLLAAKRPGIIFSRAEFGEEILSREA